MDLLSSKLQPLGSKPPDDFFADVLLPTSAPVYHARNQAVERLHFELTRMLLASQSKMA